MQALDMAAASCRNPFPESWHARCPADACVRALEHATLGPRIDRGRILGVDHQGVHRAGSVGGEKPVVAPVRAPEDAAGRAGIESGRYLRVNRQRKDLLLGQASVGIFSNPVVASVRALEGAVGTSTGKERGRSELLIASA